MAGLLQRRRPSWPGSSCFEIPLAAHFARAIEGIRYSHCGLQALAPYHRHVRRVFPGIALFVQGLVFQAPGQPDSPCPEFRTSNEQRLDRQHLRCSPIPGLQAPKPAQVWEGFGVLLGAHGLSLTLSLDSQAFLGPLWPFHSFLGSFVLGGGSSSVPLVFVL